ncbi:cytochrome c maturation protein CcmE [Pontibacter sp. G13]|uniref:cytochrome c maturation protein CcmE domain-containing protein n=1 Tax=Pontibacter sp. G13 TaxID=3074898 RepID=UPI00288C3C20|nr:cytochrome c maturation protein CcmE [Pontibacter sp. G13]WNJ17434.1 cytochrome c maturation protein CcmE [Pontibacter sp. G13]
MKISHIVILVGLAVFVVMLGVNFSENKSTYTVFADAKSTGDEVHIVGQWVQRDQTTYDASRDLFTFFLQDTVNQVEQVLYHDPKPINFEQAEKVVVVGSYNDESQFVADRIVMKCPSKYEPDDITAAEQ